MKLDYARIKLTALRTVQHLERPRTGRLQQSPKSGKFRFDPSCPDSYRD
jgi:hypothetical protein